MIRLLIYVLIIYFVYRFIKGIWVKSPRRNEVKGQQKSKPLDLSNEDVEDAHFEDVEDGDR